MQELATLQTFLADPVVQSVLTPLAQGIALIWGGVGSLKLAYLALSKALTAFKGKPSTPDAFAASLLDSLDGECVLTTTSAVDAKGKKTEYQVLMAANATFVPVDANDAEVLVNGVDVLHLVPSKADRKRITRKVQATYDRLEAERAANERYRLAMLVSGCSEPQGDQGCGCLPYEACSDCPDRPKAIKQYDNCANASLSDARKNTGPVPILGNSPLKQTVTNGVKWTGPVVRGKNATA